MFRSITLKNYRTHLDTTLRLSPVTLLIGANNAGKSNFFSGIRHFSRLIARGRPREVAGDSDEPPEDSTSAFSGSEATYRVHPSDFFPHRHRLTPIEAPMEFACEWSNRDGDIRYRIRLVASADAQCVHCHEWLRAQPQKQRALEFSTDNDPANEELKLEANIRRDTDSSGVLQELVKAFFRDLAGCFSYHLEPSCLRGWRVDDKMRKPPLQLAIASQLGGEGANLQPLLRDIEKRDPRVFDRFILSLRRFEPSFQTTRYDSEKGEVVWKFDLGRNPPRAEEFPPHVVSEGVLRAAAVALLTAMPKPPALILLEEIEDGISQRNIGRLIEWLHQAAGTPEADRRGYRTQFLITSHSPAVVRQFWENLDAVYYFRLDRGAYRSVATNLNDSLAAFVDMGSVEPVEDTLENGKRLVKIAPDKLLELWFSGAIGGEL